MNLLNNGPDNSLLSDAQPTMSKELYVHILLILMEGNFIESIMDISIWNLNM